MARFAQLANFISDLEENPRVLQKCWPELLEKAR